MNKVTLLFPGQGSQYVGMGKNLKEDSAYSVFKAANDALNYSITDLCDNGPEEELKLTQNAQPAIVTHSLALYNYILPVLKEKNIEIEQVLGHSVGEYSALSVAGAFAPTDAIKSVHYRGRFMQESVPAGVGKMIAIMRVDAEKISEACKLSSNETETVMPANFNEPGQIVISGHAPACERAVKWLEENVEGRFRAIELKVSAPFHSSLMIKAAEKLNIYLNEVPMNPNTIPYFANIDSKNYSNGTSAETIKENLIKQVAGSVRWTQSIQKLTDDTICLEVGPGKVLTGLIKKINPNIRTLAIDQEDILNKLREFLQ
jgi:[acyl-carrier-protein] S-malonyltransferase